jgi:dsDNA-specific endonuclease/ATPase MutS2
MSKSILHLDLHDIAKNSRAINDALQAVLDEAEEKRVRAVEIIPGKGSGQLMKRVKKFLSEKGVKERYKRLEVDTKNHGRLFVHFR